MRSCSNRGASSPRSRPRSRASPTSTSGTATDGEITLAGVMNDGTAPPAGAFAGPYAWNAKVPPAAETNLGGAARGYYTQDERAISPDGATVYFTAGETGQLYLRRNPTAAQSAFTVNGAGEEECTEPAKACTVHVSASEKTNGGGEGGRDNAGARPAAFMQASADGSGALFTSPEKLTDDATTGPEPPSCRRSPAPTSTAPAIDLDFHLGRANGVTVAGGYIYWAEPQAGTIGRAKLNGAGATDPTTFIVPGPTEFEASPARTGSARIGARQPPVPRRRRRIHLLDQHRAAGGRSLGQRTPQEERPVDGAGTIGRAKLGVSGPQQVEPAFITGASNPLGIAVDAEHIYWANDGLGEGSDCGEITPELPRNHLSKRGIGRASRLGPPNPDQTSYPSLQAAAGQLLASRSMPNIYFVTVDARGSGEEGGVQRYDLGGKFTGNLNDVPPGYEHSRLRGIAVDGAHIYWAGGSPRRDRPPRTELPRQRPTAASRNSSPAPGAQRASPSTANTSTGRPTRKSRPIPATTSTAMTRTPLPGTTSPISPRTRVTPTAPKCSACSAPPMTSYGLLRRQRRPRRARRAGRGGGLRRL